MTTLLLILAAILVIAGIFAIVRGALLWGIVLIVVGLLVGPGGVSVFSWASAPGHVPGAVLSARRVRGAAR